MKTSTIVLSVLLLLQVPVLSALGLNNCANPLKGAPVADLTALIPVTPAEATFEEMEFRTPDPGALAPVMPSEAEFEEFLPEENFSALMPVTPAEADFSDQPVQPDDLHFLATTTPETADFE